MARARDLHVVTNSTRGGWNVVRGRRRLSHHRTQQVAVTAGRRVARRMRVDLVTHGRDGRIRAKDSFGNETSRRDCEH